MKVPWPLTDREIIVHYFIFEYFKDGLVVILLNTVKQKKIILPMVLKFDIIWNQFCLQLLDLWFR